MGKAERRRRSRPTSLHICGTEKNSREDIFAGRYLCEKIFSLEIIFAGRYFRVNSIFAKISSPEIQFSRKFSSAKITCYYSRPIDT